MAISTPRPLSRAGGILKLLAASRSEARPNLRSLGVLKLPSAARSGPRPTLRALPIGMLTVHQLVRTGLAEPGATQGSERRHRVLNDGRVFLEFSNASASVRIVTVQTPATLQGLAVEDVPITIPGNAARFKAGPFETALFNRPHGMTDAGHFYLDYPSEAGQHADITVRAFKI